MLGDHTVKGMRVTSIDGGLRRFTGSSAERNQTEVGIVISYRGVLDEGIEHSLVGAIKLLRSRNKIRDTLQRKVGWRSIKDVGVTYRPCGRERNSTLRTS